MSKLGIWIKTARLRTLPLSLSGIIAGSALAIGADVFSWSLFIVALLTTILFQILSNFANDYGDGVKGTDNVERVGPQRSLQSGMMSVKELKNSIVVLSIVSILSSSVLIYLAFSDLWYYVLIFLALAILSVWAAIQYTVGEKAYGYKGLGDLFVFLFFGLLGVLGSVFLYTKSLHLDYLLPALVIGSLSSAVLNLNNLRDHINDKNSYKNTLVVVNGFKWGKKYHLFLMIVAFSSAATFSAVNHNSWLNYGHLIVFIFFVKHLKTVLTTTNPANFDPELKKVAIGTFLWAILFLLTYL